MNIQQIKKAIDDGLTVKWCNANYDVIKDSIGQYLIVCRLNGYTIGLHGQKGSSYENVLNADESGFYVVTA